tara:strand:- start:36 stop:236 length:201 start_codon:yes stop_codon:yes gene_type:complete
VYLLVSFGFCEKQKAVDRQPIRNSLRFMGSKCNEKLKIGFLKIDNAGYTSQVPRKINSAIMGQRPF